MPGATHHTRPPLSNQTGDEAQQILDLAALKDSKEGIRQGLEQLHCGEGRPAREFFDELREKHGLSR